MYNFVFLQNVFCVVVVIVYLKTSVKLVKAVSDFRKFERESDDEWCDRFEYVIDVKIKNKKFMDFTVDTIMKDIFKYEEEKPFNILDKGGRRCLMMCNPIPDYVSEDVIDAIKNNKLLSAFNFVKSVRLYKSLKKEVVSSS